MRLSNYAAKALQSPGNMPPNGYEPIIHPVKDQINLGGSGRATEGAICCCPNSNKTNIRTVFYDKRAHWGVSVVLMVTTLRSRMVVFRDGIISAGWLLRELRILRFSIAPPGNTMPIANIRLDWIGYCNISDEKGIARMLKDDGE